MPDDLVWILPAAAVAFGLATVLVWRTFRRRRFRRSLRTYRRQLDSFDPDTRATAGEDIVELGLRKPSASVLVHYIAREEDAQVRLRIALAVDRLNGQQQSHRRRVRRLRAWAVDELIEHGHPVHQALLRKQTKRKKRPRKLRWRAPAAS